MPSLFQALVVVPVRIWGLLRRREPLASRSRLLPVPPLLPEAPRHADGRAMTIQEVHVWRAMQQVISTHWPELRAVPDTNVRSYPPADRAWGGMIQVYGTEHVVLRIDTGNWEAEISPEGRVEVPQQKT
jgi:hypothetical protein